ncbi:MAG TPA: VWA domain-containing protein, partial [Planctomycetota bacterium]|nr:VWA domain-containing protein [Planctomycetota bacterium]
FYDEDIPTTTDSVIFVVDRSGSMDLKVRPFTGLDGEPVVDGSRLDYVKTELIRSIATLPPSFSFNLITFSECVESWRPARAPATAANKAAATDWVRRIVASGWTNTGGAASLALSDRGNRTVMLLTDGEPNFLDCAATYAGDYDTHRRVIRTANVQRAAIHCFGIALDEQTRGFMQRLAADSDGTFRELDP